MAPLAAIPSVRRILNPLCQMLGIPKLPPVPPVPPLPKRPATVAPESVAAPRPVTSKPAAPEQASDGTPARHPPPPPTTPVAA
jgi:hypothetical protein